MVRGWVFPVSARGSRSRLPLYLPIQFQTLLLHSKKIWNHSQKSVICSAARIEAKLRSGKVMGEDNELQENAPDEPNNWQRPFSMAGQTEADRQKLIELRKADRRIITIKERQDIFLEEYLRCKNKRKALDACGETYPTLAKWRGKDAEFAQKYMIAVMEICDEMEDEAYRRGVQGVTKPIFYAGKHVGDVQEYSDALLMFSLKGMMPEKYRENQGVSVGVGGSTVLIMPSNGRELGKVSDLPFEELPKPPEAGEIAIPNVGETLNNETQKERKRDWENFKLEDTNGTD